MYSGGNANFTNCYFYQNRRVVYVGRRGRALVPAHDTRHQAPASCTALLALPHRRSATNVGGAVSIGGGFSYMAHCTFISNK